MSKYFRPWNIDQTLLLPPHVQDFVPKGHVSRFIVELVRESLDLKEITGSYVSGLGQPPFDPRMMVALLLHGYARDRKSTRLNSSHMSISYAVFCLKKKKKNPTKYFSPETQTSHRIKKDKHQQI